MRKFTKFLYLLIISSLSLGLYGCGVTPISPLPDAPKAPVSLTLKVLSHNSIELTWLDQADNEAGFRVYRKREGGSFYKTANLEPDTERYVDTNLDPETLYYYYVSSHNLGGEGKSVVVSGKTESEVKIIEQNWKTEYNIFLEWVTTINGKVKNNTSETISWVTIQAQLFDAGGVLISSTLDFIFDLGAGVTATFEMTTWTDEKPTRVEIWVET